MQALLLVLVFGVPILLFVAIVGASTMWEVCKELDQEEAAAKAKKETT
jgi:hypothetical protein